MNDAYAQQLVDILRQILHQLTLITQQMTRISQSQQTQAAKK
jgi:hypothetical protein